VEWIQSEKYPWYGRKWWALTSYFGMRALLGHGNVGCLQDHIESTLFRLQR
jgi:hypothetical protein